MAAALAIPLARAADFTNLYTNQDLSQRVCESRTTAGGASTLFCTNSDVKAGDDFVQDCSSPTGSATTRTDQLFLDFGNAATGHNNMGGNGCGYDRGDKGPNFCTSTDSTACALCGPKMNHGVCAGRDGLAYGAGEWEKSDCSAFSTHPWYQDHVDNNECWFSKTSSAGTVNGAVPGAPGISQTTGRAYSGLPTPRYRGDGENSVYPNDNGGDDGTNNARTNKLDDMCYEGSMLMNVVGNVEPGQRVDMWFYPGRLEPTSAYNHFDDQSTSATHGNIGTNNLNGDPKYDCDYSCAGGAGTTCMPCGYNSPYFMNRIHMNYLQDDRMFTIGLTSPGGSCPAGSYGSNNYEGHPWDCVPIAHPYRFEFWLSYVDSVTGADEYKPIALTWFTFSFYDFDRDRNRDNKGGECLMFTGFEQWYYGDANYAGRPQQIGSTAKWEYDADSNPVGPSTGSCTSGAGCQFLNRAMFCEGTKGWGRDNPKDGPFELNEEQQGKSLGFMLEETQFFDAVFITRDGANGGRNFLFSGTSNIIFPCPAPPPPPDVPPPGEPPAQPPPPPPAAPGYWQCYTYGDTAAATTAVEALRADGKLAFCLDSSDVDDHITPDSQLFPHEPGARRALERVPEASLRRALGAREAAAAVAKQNPAADAETDGMAAPEPERVDEELKRDGAGRRSLHDDLADFDMAAHLAASSPSPIPLPALFPGDDVDCTVVCTVLDYPTPPPPSPPPAPPPESPSPSPPPPLGSAAAAAAAALAAAALAAAALIAPALAAAAWGARQVAVLHLRRRRRRRHGRGRLPRRGRPRLPAGLRRRGRPHQPTRTRRAGAQAPARARPGGVAAKGPRGGGAAAAAAKQNPVVDAETDGMAAPEPEFAPMRKWSATARGSARCTTTWPTLTWQRIGPRRRPRPIHCRTSGPATTRAARWSAALSHTCRPRRRPCRRPAHRRPRRRRPRRRRRALRPRRRRPARPRPLSPRPRRRRPRRRRRSRRPRRRPGRACRRRRRSRPRPRRRRPRRPRRAHRCPAPCSRRGTRRSSTRSALQTTEGCPPATSTSSTTRTG